jgi:hypothetical protein
MVSTLRRSILGGLLVGILVLQTGCAGRRVPPPRLDAPARDALGTVAVSWVEAAPRVEVYSAHSAGRGAAMGAATGAKAGLPLMAMGQVPHIAGAVVGLAGIGVALTGALIGAPIGAVIEATKAPPKTAVKEVAATFATYAAPLDIVGCIGGRIHQTVRQQTSTWTVLAPIPAGAPSGDPDRYRTLARDGIDTVIELGALSLEVSGPFGTHPDGSVILRAPMRLVRVRDGMELLAHEFRWAQAGILPAPPADAPAFGEAIERACTSVALDVIHSVLGPVESAGTYSEPDDRRASAPQE